MPDKELDEVVEPRQQFNVTFDCTFCGNSEVRQFPVNLGRRTLKWCKRCGVTEPRKGMTIRYGSPERSADAAFADTRMERGRVYTVRKIDRQQHGTRLELEEVYTEPLSRGRYYPTFDLMLFTPLACDVEAARRWRQEQRKQKEEAGGK